jgi:hypothetical protein
MKYFGKITITLFVLLAAGSLSLSAQRGMRGMRADTSRMKRPVMEQMHRIMQENDSVKMGMMGRDMMRMRMHVMRPPMFPMHDMWGPAPGMRYRGMYDLPGMRHGLPGMRAMDNIPNLTDSQKKEIEDMMQKQQSEMQKFRNEMQEKMKEMRESHRSKLIDLLTDEQKKWFDENSSKPQDK